MSQKNPEVTSNPTAKASVRFVNTTPMKARRVIDLVRGKNVANARDILRFSPQAAAEPIAKLLESAIANAENNQGLDARDLVVSSIYANEGPTMKRIKPGSQGRAFRIRKRTAHIDIVLESISQKPKAKAKAKKTAKASTKTTKKGDQ